MKVAAVTIDNDEEEIKTTMRIPKNILRAYKHFAADDDITLAQLITKVLKDYANKRTLKK